MKKIAAWIDQHGMFALSLFLLLFIPLYPKLPLLEAIPGYLVRVRLEDLAVAVVGGFWFIQLWRKKIAVSWPMVALITGYALAGLLSLVVAIGLQQTIPLQLLHIGKSGLHYARYLEYFSLFFFLYSGIRTKQHLHLALASLLAGLAFIIVYGFGQRYWEWPVFSTMNREFSKGEALTLSEAARVHSTFGGHYDLAAYLVALLPIVFCLCLMVPSKKVKVISGVVAAGGSWLLLASAQKTSLFAFVAAAAVIWFRFLSTKFGWVKTALITTITGVGGVIALVIFLNTIGCRYAEKITDALAGKPSDLPQDFVGGQLDENWSENAKKYGLSMGIRLDTLWPQALYGFSLNPWTGKGYATLNKQGVNEFTEADSTDNNYFRTLGETGLLGTIFFFGIIWYIGSTIRRYPSKEPVVQALVLGYTAGLVGLLFNALIIDVFSASKVAFSFWGLTGLVVAAIQLGKEKQVRGHERATLLSWVNTARRWWPLIITTIILVLLTHKRPFSEYSPIQGFSFAQSTALNVHAASCLASTSQACGDILSQVPTLALPYVWYLTLWYKLFNQPGVYYFANIVVTLGGLIIWQRNLLKTRLSSLLQFTFLIVLVTPVVRMQLTSIASRTNLIIFVTGLLFSWLAHQKMTTKAITQLQKLTVSRPKLAATISLVLIGAGFLHMSGGHPYTTVLKNFRDGYDVHHFRAVRRLNGFMQNLAAENPAPVMLTFLNPHYVALFNHDQYQVQAPPTAETTETYRQQLNQGALYYFTNAANGVEELASLASALELADNFGLQLDTIDCEHRCNIYRVLTEPLPLPTEAKTANQQQFKNQDKYQLLIGSNQLARFFNPSNYTPNPTNPYKKFLTESEADGYIFVGASADKVEENHGSFFRTQFIDQTTKPVIYAIGDNSPRVYESYGPPYQRFVLGKTMIMVLDDTVSDRPTAQQHLLIDTLLQLYQHPEITDLVIISNTQGWTKGLTTADKNSISQYTAAHELKWHFFSSETNDFTPPTDLHSYINDEVRKKGAYIHSEPINVLYLLTITEQGVLFKPIQFNPNIG